MDSTLISIECIDEIADFAGRKAEVAAGDGSGDARRDRLAREPAPAREVSRGTRRGVASRASTTIACA